MAEALVLSCTRRMTDREDKEGVVFLLKIYSRKQPALEGSRS